jgi:tetratricopeptide (TPR) repeat protein
MTKDPCPQAARDDVFEAYLRGALSASERETFEDHFFVCATCLARLRAYEGLRAELGTLATEAPPAQQAVSVWRWRWALVPVAAALVLVAAVALWLRGFPPATPRSTVAVVPAPQSAPAASPAAPRAPEAPVPAPVVAQPGTSAPATTQTTPPASPPVVALSVLARIQAPPYAPAVLRGLHDEAAAKFDAAMGLYVKRDYRGAVPGLKAAIALRPDIPHYAFFLGACYLLTEQTDPAVAELQKTIAIGESPYLDEAHFYLAKARLRQGDIAAAREELERVIERQGRLEAEARRLLAEVDALQQKR